MPCRWSVAQWGSPQPQCACAARTTWSGRPPGWALAQSMPPTKPSMPWSKCRCAATPPMCFAGSAPAPRALCSTSGASLGSFSSMSAAAWDAARQPCRRRPPCTLSWSAVTSKACFICGHNGALRGKVPHLEHHLEPLLSVAPTCFCMCLLVSQLTCRTLSLVNSAGSCVFCLLRLACQWPKHC